MKEEVKSVEPIVEKKKEPEFTIEELRVQTNANKRYKRNKISKLSRKGNFNKIKKIGKKNTAKNRAKHNIHLKPTRKNNSNNI